MHQSVVIAFVALAMLGGVARAEETDSRLLVSPAWLAERLEDPSVVVLHVASLRADYDREHVPGARFLWLPWLAESTPDQSFRMPPVDTLDQVLERLGVSNRSRVVIYHVLGDVTAAARVYVTLDYLGMGDRSHILDGGLEAWKAEGRPVTSEAPEFARGDFAPRVEPAVLANLEEVAGKQHHPTARIVDGRSPQGYNAPAGVGAVRGGHIPGALNLPYSAVLDSTHRYLPLDTLAVRFARAGLEPGNEVITYCNVGRTACPVYVAARLLGYRVRLYDGSFEEWSRRLDLPVEGKAGK